jgi:hypothetical protein
MSEVTSIMLRGEVVAEDTVEDEAEVMNMAAVPVAEGE